MQLLTTILNFLETKFAYVFTAVTAAVNAILSEIPDDEIGILHGAMLAAGSKLKSGGTAEEALTAALNYAQGQEIAELSKVAMSFLDAFIAATAAKAA